MIGLVDATAMITKTNNGSEIPVDDVGDCPCNATEETDQGYEDAGPKTEYEFHLAQYVKQLPPGRILREAV